MLRPSPVLGGLTLTLLVLVLAGCTKPTPDPLVEAGRELLQGFDPAHAPDAGFAALNQFVSEQPDLAARVAAGLLDEADEDTRYAAVYVLGLAANDGSDAPALEGVLEDDAGYLRAIAAGSLIGLGDAKAIPVLIELLVTTDEIPCSAPSVFVDRFSSQTLTTYTGRDFGILKAESTAARTAAQQRWRDWWRGAKATLRWDPAARRFDS